MIETLTPNFSLHLQLDIAHRNELRPFTADSAPEPDFQRFKMLARADREGLQRMSTSLAVLTLLAPHVPEVGGCVCRAIHAAGW